jgi:DNA repair protein SbcC/Rad50
VIPALLTMKNFMCYRDNVPTLNFEGIHVACLCGDNGSGKSSIFDAMAWALWGEASRGKSNDDLIFAGQNEMEVELEFMSGPDRYRVIRKHVRSGATRSGPSLLDLHIYDGATFKSISEHTKTQTQDKIQNLLHLDYQTFINSAMILQGRSNEFSNKRPGERKEILASILDLSFYDQLEQQARANAESKKSECTILERDAAKLANMLDAQPQLEDSCNKILAELESLEQARKKVDNDVAVCRKKKEALAARKETMDVLKQQLSNKKRELNDWDKRLAESTRSIEHFNSLLNKAAEIEQGFSNYKDTTALEEAQNEKLKKSLDLVQRRGNLESLISSLQNTYNGEKKLLSTRVTELREKSARLPELQQKLSTLVTEQNAIQKREEEITAKRQLVNEFTGLISRVSALNSELYATVEDIKKKLGMLSETGAACPLCETELGPDGRTRIEHKLSQELEQKLVQSQENVAKIGGYRAELSVLEKEIRQTEITVKAERDTTKQQTAIMEKELRESQAAGEELAGKEAAMRDLEDDIRNKNFALDEQKALAAIVQEQGTLGYDAATHNTISQRRTSLQKFDQLNKELSDARLQLQSQQKTKEDSEIAAARLGKEIDEFASRCLEIEKDLAELPVVTASLQSLEQNQKTIAVQERNIRDRLVEYRENLRQLAAVSEEKLAKEALIVKCRDEESIYSELARDFSKKGIQALIIEEALPEIGNEANILLGKMTDNRMSLALVTQRDTKKGDTVETLDIKISDELGTRGYDMYSGGEAFRIDLALRIAISRLLVRRAGATMPILIIDEGFGTQDSAGLEKLVEAINAIQDDFEKVFVITHLEELKDRFPVLINISKTPEGSTITVGQ